MLAKAIDKQKVLAKAIDKQNVSAKAFDENMLAKAIDKLNVFTVATAKAIAQLDEWCIAIAMISKQRQLLLIKLG